MKVKETRQVWMHLQGQENLKAKQKQLWVHWDCMPERWYVKFAILIALEFNAQPQQMILTCKRWRLSYLLRSYVQSSIERVKILTIKNPHQVLSRV